jgi:hypothetical protein
MLAIDAGFGRKGGPQAEERPKVLRTQKRRERKTELTGLRNRLNATSSSVLL